MCIRCCSVNQRNIWLFSVGSTLVVLGLVLMTAWPKIFQTLVNSMLPLSPTSTVFSKWVVTPAPLYFKFYMYNWTNSHLVNDSRVKPDFEEIGPYVFREIKIKEDLKWNNEEHLVTYYAHRTWYFEASKSNGSLEDLITAPHLPTVAGGKITKNLHPILRKIINFALNREGGQVAITRTTREWIFDGIYDDFLDFVARLQSPVLAIQENSFGYFYNRNDTREYEGEFTIHTGKQDLSQMGDLKYWKNSNHTGYWEGECGKVNGTTAELWAPGKKWHDPVSIFFSDASRYLNVYPQQNVSYHGIAARRYTSTDLTFDSGHKSKDTKCFCVKGRECPEMGVIDFSPISHRAPMYLSLPHFNMADKMFLENTTGLKPDPEKHIINVVVEPTLGVPLEIDGRIMISLLVERDENIDLLENFAWNFYAPLFSLQIQMTLTDDILKTVKITLNVPRIGQYFGIALTSIGVIIISVGIYLAKFQKLKEDVVAEKKETS